MLHCPFLAEYLLLLSILLPSDQHLVLLFPVQYAGTGTSSYASHFLSMVLFSIKGYGNKADKEQSSSKIGKRLSVSFFSWAGFL